MKAILAVSRRYLPGHKAGGSVRSLVNLVAWLGDEFRFDILTRDRDSQDDHPYPGIVGGTWQEVGKARVMYLSKRECRLSNWHRLLSKSDYGVLYLNSFFDTLTVRTLVLRRLRLLPDRPAVLAPRGEFSPGALALKHRKKRAFLAAASFLGLWRNLVWLATSDREAKEIRVSLADSKGALTIRVVPSLTDPNAARMTLPLRPSKSAGGLRIAFVSRVSRMKNLDYALQLLTKLSGDVQFDIYGPAEDPDYWAECQAIIHTLPSNVKVVYHGPVLAEDVPGIFAGAHLFLFPTRGENFGHVIVESLRSGCPVLISDRTPWRELAARYAGWDISLDQPEHFQRVLAALVAMDENEFARWSAGAGALATTFISDPTHVDANRRLFLEMLGGGLHVT
jgi:glycosyltransferase involved in cell wall biosynthesis